jgi:ATP-dependent HslUV protease subunit HslV
MKGTTVLGIINSKGAALGADGQITLDDTVLKAGAVKIRRLYNKRFWRDSPAPPPML